MSYESKVVGNEDKTDSLLVAHCLLQVFTC